MPTTKRLLTDETGQSIVTALTQIKNVIGFNSSGGSGTFDLVFSDDGNGAVTISIDYSGTPAATIQVTGVSFASASGSVAAGGSFTLVPVFAPSDATTQTGTWATSNSSVATVSNGTVNAVATGSANITFTSTDGSYTATYALTVTAAQAPVAVTGVSFASDSGSLAVGENVTLTPVFTPSDATTQTGTWATSNSAVATVSNGTVHAVAAGSANITFTSTDGNYTATYALTVSSVAVTGVSFASGSGSLTAGGSMTLTPVFTPSNATVKTGTWATSDSAVATVSNGSVSAVAAGSANITFTSTDGNYTATYTLTVNAAQPAGASNNILNPAKEQLNWTRSVGEGYYLKVEATRINGLGANASYQYLGCYDISDLHLSGATVVFNFRVRTLGLSKTVLNSSYKSGDNNGLGILLSSDSAPSVGANITFPVFDESEYKYLGITAQSATSILSMFDGDKPLYMSKKVPYNSNDVDEYHA